MKDEAPPPAEAATEIGIDDGPEALGSLVIAGALVVAVIATVSIFLGYLW